MLIVFQAFNVFYFRYNVLGMNVVFVNLTPLVIFRVVLIVLHMAGMKHVDFLPGTLALLFYLFTLPEI